MCARLKWLPTGQRGRNKEERHRKLLICAPDCQSATRALHYRHEERSSASSNPSVLFNYIRAPRTNTHAWCRFAHAHNFQETMRISLSRLTHRLLLCVKEKRRWISLAGMRRTQAAGVQGSRLRLSPRLHSQHAIFQLYFNPYYTHTYLYQQPPGRFFVIECLHSPAR